MQRHILSAALLAVAIGTQPVAALETTTEQEITALGAIGAGALAGGPVGALVGMVGGAWLVNRVGRAGELDATQASLAALEDDYARTRESMAQLEQDLAASQLRRERLLALSARQLQLAMLFRTGESDLSAAGQARLESLAAYLREHPQLQVRVEGFADPRGLSDDNQQLSEARAQAVAARLEGSGVGAARIRVIGHGEALSTAPPGDADAWAMDRRVVIHLATDGEIVQREP